MDNSKMDALKSLAGEEKTEPVHNAKEDAAEGECTCGAELVCADCKKVPSECAC